jgi:hypothetical protein
MRKVLFAWAVLGLVGVCAAAAEKYNGPRPPKPDLPYLVHASNLIPTEAVVAQEQEKKNDTLYTIPGATSNARTPLAEPIFLLEADKLNPEKISLYRFDTKSSQRELEIPKKAGKRGPRPFRLEVTRIEGRLYRIEVEQTLENGEYSLSPDDSNEAFCFTVY